MSFPVTRLRSVGHRRNLVRGWGNRSFERLENRNLLASDLIIAEFVANNRNGLRDEEGDRTDWLEIYNAGAESVNLDGYFLTDDAEDLTKWKLPATELAAKAYEVVFASGKNRRVAGEPLHTSFRLSSAGESLILVEPDGESIVFAYHDYPAQHEDASYGTPQAIEPASVLNRATTAKYLIPTEENPGADVNWTDNAFDDSTWSDGVGSIGHDQTDRLNELIDTDVQDEMRDVNTTAFVRYTVPIDQVTSLQGVRLNVRYDDGYIVYLNGTEVARRNAPVDLTYDARATTFRAFDDKPVPEPVDISEFADRLLAGDNLVAIHGLNRSPRASYFVSPELVIERPGAVFVDQARFFKSPTPGGPNGVVSYGGVLNSVAISLEHGFYETPQEAVISGIDPGVSVAYTLDGSTPTADNGTVVAAPDESSLATTAVPITRTTTLRAVAIKDDFASASPETATYIFVDDVITQSADGSTPAGWPSERVNGQLFTYGMDPDVVEDPRYAPLMRDALLDISSISIVTDQEHLFAPETGIYVNGRRARSEGTEKWERPTSVELIHPDGTPGFQIDAGLRMRGGASRSPENPKHAFRLFFRGEYGEPKLRYPFFEEEGVDEFDAIDLRSPSLISWHWCFLGSERFRCENNTFLRDVFARDTQRDMGHPYTRSRYHHVYVNGHYLGLYQSQERPEASFAESYLGGDKEDYDVIKVEVAEPERVISATDGSVDAWRQLWSQARDGFETDESYYRVQGLNPDGTRNLDYPVLLNVENLIDYMLLQFYGGNLDGPISDNIGNTETNNWISIRDRTGDDGFLFFAHDSEYMLLDVEENRLPHWPVGEEFESSNPQWIHQQLTKNRRYRETFADRAYQHLFNDGALTPEAALDRIQSRIDEVELAIIAESARWGDSNRTNPFTKEDWLKAVSHIVDTYVPQRTEIFIEQLKHAPLSQFSDFTAPLLPDVAAPAFSQHGGRMNRGDELTMAADDTIFFTLDGSDPKADAVDVEFDLLVSQDDRSRFLVPTNDGLGQEWTSPDFDDAGWSDGRGGLGFELNGDQLADGIGTNLLDAMHSMNSSVYVRIPFLVEDPNAYDVLQLAMQYDDGFIAYLNGTELARSNFEGDPSWDSVASRSRPTSISIRKFESMDVSRQLHLLRAGENVLTIHGVNRRSTDRDFFLLPELRGGSVRDAAITSAAQPYTAAIEIDDNTVVTARSLRGHEWSALTQATFTVASMPLRISEVMYHPSDPNVAEQSAGFTDDDDFEFIELTNTSATQTLDLTGVTLSNGIRFTFPQLVLGPSQQIVVVRDADAFQHRYGSDAVVAGVYGDDDGGTRLDNAGETIRLVDHLGILIQEVAYDDLWYPETDGRGFSLQALDDSQPNEWSTAAGWRASFLPHGSPGRLDRRPGDANGDGVFNSDDLVFVQIAGEYNDGEPNNSTFEEGDWNGDGDFDSHDLVLAFQLGAYEVDAPAVLRMLPPISDGLRLRTDSDYVSSVDHLLRDENLLGQELKTMRLGENP